MKEKTILAYFKSPEEAREAANKLKALRVADLSIDRVDKYPGDGVGETMNPLTGDFPGLGYLTQDADFTNKSAAILAAADIDASGMSDGGQEEPHGRDVLLTVVTDEETFDRAVQVIRQAGGEI